MCDGALAPLEMTLQHSAGAGVGMPAQAGRAEGQRHKGTPKIEDAFTPLATQTSFLQQTLQQLREKCCYLAPREVIA